MAKPTFPPTAEQQSVIDHRGGHLQVIASAGAGKTEAISRRVTSLIEEGAEPGEIIAFTFTERAAESLKTRITRRIAEAKGEAYLDRLNPMYIGTIHAYCLRMLQDHVPEFGDYDILDENRLAGLLSREHRRLELSKIGHHHWRPIRDFLRNADVVENELLDATKLKGTPFGNCYLEFKKSLQRYHFLTYGLLISAAVKALARPEVFAAVHGNLKHLIVDEYQDVNPAQEKLIAMLARDPVSLCVVADDDQSIYQWRGSNVSNMLEFTSRYTATSRTLSVNRRSRPTIIHTANTFAVSISPRLPKKMDPFRPAGGVELLSWSADTAEDEAEVIAQTVLHLHARGYRYKDVAILYRSVRTSSPPLLDRFKELGIPFRCSGRTGLFLQPETAALGKLYAWLSGNDWKTERFGTSEPVEQESLAVEFEAAFNGGLELEELREYLTDWKNMVGDTSGEVNFVRDYYRLLRRLGVADLDLADPVSCTRMGTLARFSVILADYEHVTRRSRYEDGTDGKPEFRSGRDRGRWYYQGLFNYLQHYALDKYEDFDGEDTLDVDAVDILTIHQAKGLEWPVVFLPSLVEGRFPSKFAGKPQDWLIDETLFPPSIRARYEGSDAEERRLFYVAMTRARDTLYLSRFHRKVNTFKASPYLLEVAGTDPAIHPKGTPLPLPEPYTPPAEGDAEELRTVSFSELALFEQCPRRYRFSSSFGFQAQLVSELGYGNAIHHIIRIVAEQSKATGKPPLAAEIDKLFSKFFYLPFASTAAFDSLQKRARELVNKYITDYPDDLSRVWQTERPFELHLPHGIVSDRADVILDRDKGKVGRLAIVDYKTASEAKTDDLFAFQLAVYAAAGKGEGVNVQAAYLHELKESKRLPIPVDSVKQKTARGRADLLLQSIAAGEFPERPEATKCKRCDMRSICKDAEVGKYDV